MLTIKLRDHDGDAEKIIEARTAEMRKGNGVDEKGSYEETCIKAEDGKGAEFWINTGTVYVMNERGTTVAKYSLGRQYNGAIPNIVHA